MNTLPGFTSAGEKAKRGRWSEPRVSGKGKPLSTSFPSLVHPRWSMYEQVSFLKQVAFLEAITHNSVCYN